MGKETKKDSAKKMAMAEEKIEKDEEYRGMNSDKIFGDFNIQFH